MTFNATEMKSHSYKFDCNQKEEFGTGYWLGGSKIPPVNILVEKGRSEKILSQKISHLRSNDHF